MKNIINLRKIKADVATELIADALLTDGVCFVDAYSYVNIRSCIIPEVKSCERLDGITIAVMEVDPKQNNITVFFTEEFSIDNIITIYNMFAKIDGGSVT